MSQTSVEKVTLQQDRLVSRPTVHYTEKRVTVLILAGHANAWGVTDRVGIRRLPKAELHLCSESNIGSGMLVELSTRTR
jgi:hypothetical protein